MLASLMIALVIVPQAVPEAFAPSRGAIALPGPHWLGVECIADWHELQSPSRLRARGDVRCTLYDYVVTAHEVEIVRGQDSGARTIDAAVGVRATGLAKATWSGNDVSSDTILLRFSGPGALSQVLLDFTGNALLLDGALPE